LSNIIGRTNPGPLGEWIRSIDLDACMFGTHSLRRTKATLIYRRTGNLRAVIIGPFQDRKYGAVPWHRGR
jgi:hypothetical protein